MQEQYLGLTKELTYQQALELANGNQLYVKLNFGYGVTNTQVNSVAHYNEVIADYLEQVGELMDYDCFVCSVPAALDSDVTTLSPSIADSDDDNGFYLPFLASEEVEYREGDFFHTLDEADKLELEIKELKQQGKSVPFTTIKTYRQTLARADKLGLAAMWD